MLEELPDEPRLADPRYADERDELRLAVLLHPAERPDQERELALSSDQRCPAQLADIGSEAGARLERRPDRNRLSLALGLYCRLFVIGDRALGGVERGLVDEDPAHR